jgi:anaerobic ribonucleoside-triphosphate reductase activating protein
MLRYHSYNIVFQEVPDEVTLAINLSNCPNGCKGCHSPHLQQDIGSELDEAVVESLLQKYGNAITCVCFMGGDADPAAVERLFGYIRQISKIKTAWYSGRPKLSDQFNHRKFDYIKIGPYIEQLGGLDSPATNQRFYCVIDGELEDKTLGFQKRKSMPAFHMIFFDLTISFI